jgi:hypothetical protein
MAWCYELRESNNRLVEMRSGFATEKEAREAATRARRMIACICYPNSEMLTVVVRETEIRADRLAEMTDFPRRWLDPQALAAGGPDLNLKYPWQRLVVEAFLERRPDRLPRKVSIAERGLSTRLLDPEPFDADERIAIGEALLALRRLIRELVDPTAEKEDIA